jgi:hypothetical protein
MGRYNRQLGGLVRRGCLGKLDSWKGSILELVLPIGFASLILLLKGLADGELSNLSHIPSTHRFSYAKLRAAWGGAANRLSSQRSALSDPDAAVALLQSMTARTLLTAAARPYRSTMSCRILSAVNSAGSAASSRQTR